MTASRKPKKLSTHRQKISGEHRPTLKLRRDIELMSAFGNTENEIARIVGLTVAAIRLHYHHELSVGLAKSNNEVAANLFRLATMDDPRSAQAATYWLRFRGGWSEGLPPAKTPSNTKPLGKKQKEAEDARNPDAETTMGELMARRAGMRSN